jgi:tetratricopeptide (TPR) repeat protein
MLRPKKKISKRELKEDALVSSYAKATAFYDRNRRNISIAVTAVVVLVLAVVIYSKNRADNNNNATLALGQIYQVYDSGQYQTAIDGLPEKGIKGLKAIVENYGNSQNGDLARFYLANAYYFTGKYEEALKEYESFSPADELLSVSRLAGIGSCHESLGRYRDAAEAFEKAVTKAPKDPAAAENLNNAGRTYALAGEKAKAIELYKRLKKDYAASTFARDADRFIAALSI